MIIRELLSVFGFKVDDEGAKKAESVYERIRGVAVGASAAAAAAATAIAAMVLETANAGDKAAKAAKRIGDSVEAIQETAYAAQVSDVSFQTLSEGLKNLGKNADNSTRGNKKVAEAFRRVGVNVRDAGGRIKPVTQLLEEVSDGISKIPSEGTRSAIAMKLFGGAGYDMIPFLLEGRDGIRALREEAQRLGFVLDAETAKKAEILSDELTNLGLVVKGARLRFGKELIPIAIKTVSALKELLIANRAVIDRGIKYLTNGIKNLISVLATLSVWVIRNRRFMAVLGTVIGALAAGNLLKMVFSLRLLRLEYIKTVLLMAAKFIIIVGLIALMAILIEDIAMGAKGLRRLRDFFNEKAQDPNANWMVKTIALILDLTVKAIEMADKFFAGFFEDAEKMGGVWNALKNAGAHAIDFWIKKLKEFFRLMTVNPSEGVGVNLFKTSLRGLLQNSPIGGFFQSIDQIDYETRRRHLPDLPRAATGGGSNLSIGAPQVNVKVIAQPGQDAAAIGREAANQTGNILDRWLGDASDHFDFGLER